MADTERPHASGFLRLPQVLHLIPVSRSTWWAGVKSGRFPAPCKLGRRVTAWRLDDIQKFMNSIATGTGD